MLKLYNRSHMPIEISDITKSPERLNGLTTLQCARIIVSTHPEIAGLNLHSYYYVPNSVQSPRNLFPIDRKTFFSDSAIQNTIDTLPQDWNLSLNSNVTLADGSLAHLQMMDLAPRKSPETLEMVKSQLTKMLKDRFGGGFILETNKSYQYLGLGILTFEDWLDFLGLNLITSIVRQPNANLPRVHDIVSDYRSIGYSILRRSTSLRLTTRGTKTFTPKVIITI